MAEAQSGYDIVYDSARRLLHLTLFGMWDLATLDAYRRALDATLSPIIKNGVLDPDIGFIVDLRGHAVQPKDVADALSQMVEEHGAAHPSAVIMSSSALQNIQVKRISTSLHRRAVFTDEAAALDWITAEQAKIRSA